MRTAETRVEEMWGTVISVDVRDAVAAAVIDDVFEWFRHVDTTFSTWRDDSEISRLGRAELRLDDASTETREVLELCDRLRAETWGAFEVNVASDPRVVQRPGFAPIDPSGVVKGWALDHAGGLLRAAGAGNFAINAGGDVLVAGAPARGERWRVGIQHPHRRDALADTVHVTDTGVATSGRYERGDHVIDPRTGAPATHLVAATVLHPELAVADAYATALVALGPDSTQWLTERPDVAAMTIDANGMVTLSAAYERHRRAVSETARPLRGTLKRSAVPVSLHNTAHGGRHE
jgi:thiamine biosynthesis lipoprotein